MIAREKCYLLSGRLASLFRFCNSCFGSKWSGLWFGSTKALDYFAYKLGWNGEESWLSPLNCSSFRASLGEAVHLFNLGGVGVEEKVSIPWERDLLVSLLKVRNKGEEVIKVRLSLEVGVNIRRRREDLHSRRYEVDAKGERIGVSNELGSIYFGIPPSRELSQKFERVERYGVHFPGRYVASLAWDWYREGEAQAKFVPGEYVLSFTLLPGKEAEIPFLFCEGEKTFEKAKRYWRTWVMREKERVARSLAICENKEMKSLFIQSMLGLRSLETRTSDGFAYFAGWPYFNLFWGRDCMLALQAAARLGLFEECKEGIRTFARKQVRIGELSGIIPNRIESGKVSYDSADSTPLWIVALSEYIKRAEDLEFAREMAQALLEALELGIRLDLDHDSLIEHGKGSPIPRTGHTWMDSLDRGKNAIEVQACWAKAFLESFDILKIVRIDSKKFLKFGRRIEKILNRKFWNEKEDFFYDRIDYEGKPDSTLTSNCLFPLAFELIDEKKAISALKRIEGEEFTSTRGVRSRSIKDKEFDPKGYHKGATWGLLTSLAALGEFRYRRIEEAWKYLKIISKNFGLRCVNCLDEIFTQGNPRGALSQGWNYASLILAIEDGMLGLQVDSLRKVILLEPRIPREIGSFQRAKIRVGAWEFWIDFKRRKLEEYKIGGARLPILFKSYGKEIIVDGERWEDEARIKPRRRIKIEVRE